MSNHAEDIVSGWRSEAGEGNPAGALFVGGEFAESDIVGDVTIKTIGKCGTACTGSSGHPCC